jgi:thioredoxin reductase (NADPH)
MPGTFTPARARGEHDGRMVDCLVIGAGPAGLTAAIYLARFRRSLVLADAGRSRARLIPISKNTPGFPGGVHGETLLAELREQAGRFGVEPQACRVTALRRDGDGFVATLSGADCNPEDDGGSGASREDVAANATVLHAERVILATGVVDALPDIDGCDAAIRAGVVRLCAVCDGYETDGRRVGVYAPADTLTGHARWMRSLCRDVTAIVAKGTLGEDARRELEGLGIAIVENAGAPVWDGRGRIRLTRADGGEAAFDAFYPVLGARSQSRLATALGAECTKEGDLVVDEHQRTTVPGLYAIGDVVSALNQISVGYGHAAIAATAVHNELPHRSR